VHTVPVTILEMPEFVRVSQKLMSTEERLDILSQLARNPLAGEVIPETGGLRKTRIRLADRGKRSGARLIYAYFGDDLPVFVFTCYAKGQKANLTQKEKQLFKKLLPELVKEYKKNRNERVALLRGKTDD
jgi:hypothetical protein